MIQWYNAQIYVKLHRASDSASDCTREFDDRAADPDEPADADVDVTDRDGSAKVALIGVDRSIAAWGRLYQHLPDASDSILSILLALDRLRRGIEQAFPAARTFVRPGLDEA